PAALSVVAHAVIIALWAAATLPPDSLPDDSLSNRVYYMPPPDKPLLVHGTSESVHYITFAEGVGSGPGPITVAIPTPTPVVERSPEAGSAPVDTAIKAPEPPGNTKDSVFTI